LNQSRRRRHSIFYFGANGGVGWTYIFPSQHGVAIGAIDIGNCVQTRQQESLLLLTRRHIHTAPMQATYQYGDGLVDDDDVGGGDDGGFYSLWEARGDS
jgi:hypothetical protein